MTVDQEKLADLRYLLKRAYIEGYQQGTVDEGRGDFIGDAEDRWEDSELSVTLEIAEMEGGG